MKRLDLFVLIICGVCACSRGDQAGKQPVGPGGEVVVVDGPGGVNVEGGPVVGEKPQPAYDTSGDCPNTKKDLKKKPAPDPRLAELCSRAAKKDLAALNQLKMLFPDVHPHVTAILVDENAHNRRTACEALAKLGLRGTGPVLLFALKDADTEAAAVGAAAAVIPHEPAVLDKAVKMLAYKDTQDMFYGTNRRAAAVALGVVATWHPASRPKVVAALRPYLVNSDFRVEAIQALVPCRGAAKVLDADLGKLEYDKDAAVRAAAATAVTEINRLATADAYLVKLDLAESAVSRVFYDAVVDIVSADKEAPAAALKTFQEEADQNEYYSQLMVLAQAPNAAGRDLSRLRAAALEGLQPWAFVRSRRGPLPAIFLEGHKEAATEKVAWRGLLLCGLPAVELVTTKAPNLVDKMRKDLVKQLRDNEEAARVAAAEGLAPLLGKDHAPLYDLAAALHAGSPCASRQAAATLAGAPVTLDDWVIAHYMHERYREFEQAKGDPAALATFQKHFAKLGIDPVTEARFHGSILLHPRIPERDKDTALTRLESLVPSLGKEADSKTKKEFVRRWHERHKHTFGIPPKSIASFALGYLQSALPKICMSMGPDAAILRPYVLKELDGYCFRGRYIMTGYEAIQALIAIGPGDDAQLRAVLKEAANHDGKSADDQKMKAEAQKLLQSLK